MRNDEQLIRDEIEATNTELYETALRLYEEVGVNAVLEWGRKIRLRFSLCEMCEVDTPEVGDEGDTYCCILCGSLK